MTDNEQHVNRDIATRMLKKNLDRAERSLASAYDNSIYMNAVRPAEGTDPVLKVVEDAVAVEHMRDALHYKGICAVYKTALEELEALDDD